MHDVKSGERASQCESVVLVVLVHRWLQHWLIGMGKHGLYTRDCFVRSLVGISAIQRHRRGRALRLLVGGIWWVRIESRVLKSRNHHRSPLLFHYNGHPAANERACQPQHLGFWTTCQRSRPLASLCRTCRVQHNGRSSPRRTTLHPEFFGGARRQEIYRVRHRLLRVAGKSFDTDCLPPLARLVRHRPSLIRWSPAPLTLRRRA